MGSTVESYFNQYLSFFSFVTSSRSICLSCFPILFLFENSDYIVINSY